MKYVMLSIAIIAEVLATTAMKQSDGFSRPLWAVLTVIGYGVAFFFLAQTLRTIPTGVAYAIWSGAGIVLISLAAWVLQGQKLDAPAVMGMALIVIGVVVMNVFSKVSPTNYPGPSLVRFWRPDDGLNWRKRSRFATNRR